MKNLVLLICMLSVAVHAADSRNGVETAEGHPNVIFILMDDMGYSDVLLTVGGKTLTAKVTLTKNWGTYEMMDMGVVQLNQVGTTDCTVGFGKTQKKALFNLKTVFFVPIGE